MPELSAIILAAGYSSRMGALKPLLDLGGRTLLERATRTFAAIGIDDIVVVVGHRGDEVGAAAEACGARTAANPRYDVGMYSSVQAGVAAVPEGRSVFLLPVDCPLVRPETAGRVARAAARHGAEVALPVYDGASGHPPLLGPALRADILQTAPPGGLRELLSGRREPPLRVQVDDPGVAQDADTRSDLGRLRVLAATEDLPSERRCRQVLQEAGAPPARTAHCETVATVAAALTVALNEAGQYLCVPLIVAAALLHDVARSEPRHAEAGAELVERLGYPRVAGVVARHMRLGEVGDDDLDEAHVVFLADKLVQDDRLVSLDERFAVRLERHAGDADAIAAVRARLEEARLVQARVEAVLGRQLGAAMRL